MRPLLISEPPSHYSMSEILFSILKIIKRGLHACTWQRLCAWVTFPAIFMCDIVARHSIDISLAAPHCFMRRHTPALFRAASCGYVIWDVWCICCVAVTCWVVPVTNSWWALMINDKFSVAKLKMHLVLVFECLPKIMICMREIKVFEFTDSHLFTYLLLFYHLSTFTEQLFLSIVRRCFSHFCRFHFSDQVTKLKK